MARFWWSLAPSYGVTFRRTTSRAPASRTLCQRVRQFPLDVTARAQSKARYGAGVRKRRIRSDAVTGILAFGFMLTVTARFGPQTRPVSLTGILGRISDTIIT